MTCPVCVSVTVTWSWGHVRRPAAEARIEGPPLAERLCARAQCDKIGGFAERLEDDVADLAEVLLVHPAHRRCGGADANAAGHRGWPHVERNRVAVDRELHLVQSFLRLLAGPVRRAEIELQEVCVRSAREDVEPALDQRVGEDVGVATNLRLVVAERLARGDLEAGRLRGARVLERTPLHPREDCAVDGLSLRLPADVAAGARPAD